MKSLKIIEGLPKIMVDIFWITETNKHESIRNSLEKGLRESFRVLTLEKLIEYKDEFPSYSVLCFEVSPHICDFILNSELSLGDQLLVPICPESEQDNLIELSEKLSEKNRFQLVLNPNDNIKIISQNLRTVLRLAHLSRSAREFSLVGKNLNKLVASSLSEVDRLRKLHSRIVSLRSEEIKGLKITSKFTSGTASGGEFFDMIVGEGKMLVFLSSSSSYVTTSIILTHIDILRSSKKFEPQELSKFVETILKELSKDSGDLGLELAFLVIDNKNLKMDIYNFGHSMLIGEKTIVASDNENIINSENFQDFCHSIQLERDQKYLFVSPGFTKMTAGIINNLPVLEFFKGQVSKDGSDILNEIFFHLKKNTESTFLKRDVSALVIEVQQNVMVQID